MEKGYGNKFVFWQLPLKNTFWKHVISIHIYMNLVYLHKQQETYPTTKNQIIGAHINVYNLCRKMFAKQT